MKKFPFPDKELMLDELSRDIQYNRIPEDVRLEIAETAWNTGVKAAQSTAAQHPGETIYEIAAQDGITLEYSKDEKVIGNLRYFSEYYSRENKFVLYEGSIQKWAQSNRCDYKEATEMILAHEYFHYLETTQIGELSKQYKVPTIKVGKAIVATAGIRALSEIGAHGYARTYFEQRGGIIPEAANQLETEERKKQTPTVLKNSAMNIMNSSALMRSTNLFRNLFKMKK